MNMIHVRKLDEKHQSIVKDIKLMLKDNGNVVALYPFIDEGEWDNDEEFGVKIITSGLSWLKTHGLASGISEAIRKKYGDIHVSIRTSPAATGNCKGFKIESTLFGKVFETYKKLRRRCEAHKDPADIEELRECENQLEFARNYHEETTVIEEG